MVYKVISSSFKVINIILDKLLSKKNYIIISCQRNKNYYGNSSALFEYFEEKKDNRAYYITKNKKLYNQLRIKFHKKVLYAYSLRSLLVFAKAKVLFISHGLGDISPYYLVPKSKKVINLWHSPFLKKVGIAHNGLTNDLEALISVQDYFITSSKFEAQFIKQSFNLKDEHIWITGTPRNDNVLKKSEALRNKFSFLEKRVILYAPTFRDDGSQVNYFPFSDFNLESLENYLEQNNAVVLIRGHFNEFTNHGDDKAAHSRLIMSANQDKFPDIQQLLPFVDILITDYSGVFIDFLLLDKPILFFPYDLEKYKKDRGFYYSFEDHTPGPMIYSQENFINALNTYFKNPNHDSLIRQKQRNLFFDEQDSKASYRISQKTDLLLD